MHLTPEQIDRQPFRMTRRGYDIVEVRDFLREIATEMRERRDVRSRLEAEQQAEGADAMTRVEEETRKRVEQQAQQRADEILSEARTEADALLEGAEERARERSDVVLNEAQARLDLLLEEEKELRERIEAQQERQLSHAVRSGADDTETGPVAPPTSSLADFMKSTLRQEVHPD